MFTNLFPQVVESTSSLCLSPQSPYVTKSNWSNDNDQAGIDSHSQTESNGDLSIDILNAARNQNENEMELFNNVDGKSCTQETENILNAFHQDSSSIIVF